MIRKTFKDANSIYKSNFWFLTIISALVVAVNLFNQYNNIINSTQKIYWLNFFAKFLSTLFTFVIIYRLEKSEPKCKFFSIKILVAILIVCFVNYSQYFTTLNINKSYVTFTNIIFLILNLLIFIFPYLVIKNNSYTIIQSLKLSSKYIKKHIFSVILFGVMFGIIYIILTMLYAFISISIIKTEPNNHIIIDILLFIFYGYLQSLYFAFAQNVIASNENIEEIETDEVDEEETFPDETLEESIQNEELFEELNSELEETDLDADIQKQFENYDYLNKMEFVFSASTDELSSFDFTKFLMSTNMYMCFKEDKTIQKNIKKVFQYVVLDISGYEKDSVECYYSDCFKENNNNFLVQVTITKDFENYNIQIILTINGENLF